MKGKRGPVFFMLLVSSIVYADGTTDLLVNNRELLRTQVLEAQIISTALLTVPAEEIASSLSAKKYRYAEIPVQYLEHLKGSPRYPGAPLRYYTEQNPYKIPFEQLKTLGGQKVIVFLLDYGDVPYSECMYLSGDERYSILTYSDEAKDKILAELKQQEKALADFEKAAEKQKSYAGVKNVIAEFFDENKAQNAYKKMEDMGLEAVPAMIALMNDYRELPVKWISLENKSKDAFEAFRHYSPELVIDVMAAVLNQITGYSFGFIYNGELDDFHRNHEYRCWAIWVMTARETAGCVVK